MPVTLFELIMAWVFILAIILGAVTFFVGLRKRNSSDKMLHFGVALAMPVVAWGILMLGSTN